MLNFSPAREYISPSISSMRAANLSDSSRSISLSTAKPSRSIS